MALLIVGLLSFGAPASASDEVELNISNAAVVCQTPSDGYYGRPWPGSVEVGSLPRWDGYFDWCRGMFQWNLNAAVFHGAEQATFRVFVKQAPSGAGTWRLSVVEVYGELLTVPWSQLSDANRVGGLQPEVGVSSVTTGEVKTFVFDGDALVTLNQLLNKSDPPNKFLTIRVEAVEGQTADGSTVIFGDGDGPGSRNDPQPMLRFWRNAPPPVPCNLTGDENGDWVVDVLDIMIAAAKWRSGYTIVDIQRVAANWGATCSGPP